MADRRRAGVALLVAGGFATLPLFVGSYVQHVLIVVATFAIGAYGVRLVLLAGQLNFGQAAFYATGAYTSIILASPVVGLGLPVWLSIAMAGFACAILAVIIGYPALRVRGIYFAILTLAVWGAIRQLLILDPFGLTGGTGLFPHGLEHPESIEIAGIVIDFSERATNYYLAFALLLVTITLMWRIEQSRIGLVLTSISQSGSLAASLGFNVVRVQVFAFAVGAFLAGVAGAFYSHYLLFADANLWGLWQSVYFVIFVMVAGSKYFWGPLVGSVVLLGLAEGIRATPLWLVMPESQALGLQPVIYALFLLVVVFVLPGGLLSLRTAVRQWFGRTAT